MLKLEKPSVHDARTHRIAESLFAERTHLRVERQESGDQRPLTVAGARMHHLARRLVDDREVDVVEHDVDRHAGVGLDERALRCRQDGDETLALAHGRGGLHDHLVPERDRPARDDVTGL
jgi:hypothetical protein